MGIFEQADGSAYYEQGNTRVLCAVYGPREVRHPFLLRQPLTNTFIANSNYETFLLTQKMLLGFFTKHRTR